MKDTSARNERIAVSVMLASGVALVAYSMILSLLGG